MVSFFFFCRCSQLNSSAKTNYLPFLLILSMPKCDFVQIFQIVSQIAMLNFQFDTNKLCDFFLAHFSGVSDSSLKKGFLLLSLCTEWKNYNLKMVLPFFFSKKKQKSLKNEYVRKCCRSFLLFVWSVFFIHINNLARSCIHNGTSSISSH